MAAAEAFPQVERLLSIMAKLRDPDSGCPWDLKQDFASIVPYTIEEAYEVADAIENGSMDDVQDELGDLLFQVVFYAQLGKEQQHFDFEEIAKTVADKLVRRHPHVFESNTQPCLDELQQNWEHVKQQERAQKFAQQGTAKIDESILANIPKGMAPLVKATKIQKKCAKVGFDWPDAEPVFDKVDEEIGEIKEAMQSPIENQDHVEEEVGDLLFAVVNLARHLGVDAETALRKANYKFESRFRQVEKTVVATRGSVQSSSLDQLESIWQQVKGKSTS